MSKQQIADVLARAEAILTDSHFVYAKGDHGSEYVNKDSLYTDPRNVSAVCAEIASIVFKRCRELSITDQEIAIVSPAVGGVMLSSWTTFHALGIGLKAVALYADKEGEGFVLKRGYELKVQGGRPVIVVEDILNTGGSAAATVKAVRAAGGDVVLAVALCNRGGVSASDLGVPCLCSLMEVNMKRYPANECPLCKANVPINTSVGHGKKFLEDWLETKAS